MWIVSASGRPEGDTSHVPGFGCSGGVFGACGFVVCVRALGWSDSGCQSSPVLGSGFGGLAGFPPGWLAGLQDLTREAVVDMIIWLYDHVGYDTIV